MKKNHIQFIFFSIFFLTLMIQGLITNPIINQTEALQNTPNSTITSSSHNTLSGIGYGLNYTEYANRTDTSLLSLYYNGATFASGAATTTLASTWEGYKLEMRVYELRQNRTYIREYNFPSTTPSYWTKVEVDDPSYNNIVPAEDIIIENYGGSYGNVALVKQRGVYSSGYYRYDLNDRAAYQQSITIQGGNVIWAGIDFDYRLDVSTAWESSMFHAYVRVGTAEVWQKYFINIAGGTTGWVHQNLKSIDIESFLSTVNIEMGVQSDAEVGYGRSSDPNPRFRFDNIKIYVITAVLPSTVNLAGNGLTINDNGLGNGYVTQIPSALWQTSPPVTFTWNITPTPDPNLPVTVTCKVDANLFALKEGNLLYDLAPGAFGTKYNLQDGANTSREMYSLIATPTGYWNHYLNFTIPTNWNFTGLYTPQNPLVNIIDQATAGKFGDGYIQIDLTDITNSPSGYWRYTAKSPNYVTEVTPTDAGTPETSFRVGNNLRVRSTVTDAPAGYANLSIYDPTGFLWNTEVLQPGTNQFVFSDINLVGASAPAGEYEAVVWWDNRSTPSSTNSKEAGLKRAVFSVTHATQLQSYDVATIQTDIFSDILYGETFVLKAKFTDTDNGLGIDGATVKIKWIDNVNYTMTNLGGGFYLIDSLSTAQPAGVYSLPLYASKNYYDVATKQITLELAHHTTLTPNVTSVTVDWGEIVSVQFFYNDTDMNLGISGASVWVSNGWQAGYWSNVSLGSGNYYINFDTMACTPNRIYEVDISADLMNYQAKTRQVSIFVKSRSSILSYTPPPAVPVKDAINITFNFVDGLNGSVLSNSTGQLSFTTNSSLTGYSKIYEVSPGIFYLELNTSAPVFTHTGSYKINLTAKWGGVPYYQNQTILIQLTVREIITSLIYIAPSPAPWGVNVTIDLYFAIEDSLSSQDGTGIPNAGLITVNETNPTFIGTWVDLGNGNYRVVLSTANLLVGNYWANITIYKQYYVNRSVLVGFTMRARDTDLIYETPDITPYLQNAVIKIQFRDLKNSTEPVGINNNTNPQIPGLENCAGNVSIVVTFLDSNKIPVSGTSYEVYSMVDVAGYGDGWYNVTINTASLGLTGRYYADISVNWLKLSYYNNQTIRIPFNVRNITALLEYQPPGSTPYTEGSYISVWLKYTDIDNSLPIVGASGTIYYIEDPANTPLTPFTQALGNYSVEDKANGWYLVKIYMGAAKLYDFGSYDFSIQFNKTNYDIRSIGNISFAIRQGYTQFTSPYAPLSFVLNGVVNITINYIDSESGLGIVNTTNQVLLNWDWPLNVTLHPDVLHVYGWSTSKGRWIVSGDEGNYPMGDEGRYLLQINFTNIPVGDRTMISLNISAGRVVQSQMLNITFITEPQSSIMGVTFPQPVVWGVNAYFNVTYQRTDGSGIPGTVLNLWDLDRAQYWNAAYWNYTLINPSIGLFEVVVNTTLYSPPLSGFFRIRVDVSGGVYTPRSMTVYVNVRPIDSQVTLTPPSATGWNTLANITIQYYDTYNSVPINDSNLQDFNDVIINLTNIPKTYWTLYNGPANGYYIVEINTSFWNTLNIIGHTVYIDILWEGEPYYKNWTTLSLGVPVHSRSTDLSYIPPLQIPYGENSSVSFIWRDLEILEDQGIENISGKVLFELRDSFNQPWNSSGFAWIVELGGGDYEVRINTSKLPNIGLYSFTAYFSWSGKPYYENRTISFSINVRQITTILTYNIPPPIPYGNPFQIDVQFKISDSSSSLDGASIAGAMLNITSISDSGGPLSPFSYGLNYSVLYDGLGSYTITIFNSSLDLDSYSLSIRASRYHTGQIYRNSTISLSFSVRSLTTTLTYSPPYPVPWGNSISIGVSYEVNDPDSLYWDGVGLNVANWILSNITRTWTAGVEYSVSGSGGSYIITIHNESVYGNNIGTFLFNITVDSGNDGFLSLSVNNVPFIVRALTTTLTYVPTIPQPFGNNISVEISYKISDPESYYHDGKGLSAALWSLSNGTNWNEGNEYIISGGENGNYVITIFNTTANRIGNYKINVTANPQSTLYKTASFNNIPFSVRAVNTFHLTVVNNTYYFDAIGGWPWGDLVNVEIFYNDTDHDRLVSNSNIEIRGTSGSPYESGNFTINGVETTIGSSSSGIFYLIINGTVAENAIAYNFYITLFHPMGYYLNHTFLFTISFRKSVSQIILKNMLPIVPWGDNITIVFTYNNSEIVGFPGIGGADVDITVNKIAANGFFSYHAVSAWGSGAWLLQMNTTWANVTWFSEVEITFTITAVAPNTIVAQTYYTVYIKPLESELRTTIWDSSIFLEQETNFNITVELKDRSHLGNLIENNSYYSPTGSQGQYENIHFIIRTREGEFTNYTWYWGNISILTLSPGLFKLSFFFNQTPNYPQIQELLGYLIIVEVRGARVTSSQIQVTVDLKIKTHKTQMTFNWTYANTIVTPSFNLPWFSSVNNGSKYFYGDIINVYLYWWDLDSGALNPGISAAYISTNWTDPLYYRVLNLYELNGQNESYRGIFWIQIDTNLFSDMIDNYTLQFNATLETYQRIYLLTHGYIFFEILPVPVNLTLREPILSIPYQDNAEIKIRVTNLHENNSGIFLSAGQIDIISISGLMGGSKWLVATNPLYGEYSLFFYTTDYEIGFYNATVRINKTNHEVITQNFIFQIREIHTKITLQTSQDITLKYRYEDTIRYLYMDDETYPYHIPIGTIPASPVDPELDFNITDWYNINGTAITLADEVSTGLYKIRVNASVDVGYYFCSVYVKLPHYLPANHLISINVTKASTEIEPVEPATEFTKFDVFQFFSAHFSIRYVNEFGEPMTDAIIYVTIFPGNESESPVVNLTMHNEGNGMYSIDLSTLGLAPGQTYSIMVSANSNHKNYESTELFYPNVFTIKPIWEHWSFLVGMVAIASVAGVLVYRRVKWYLTPFQVKQIIRATKLIKKSKQEAVLPVVHNRNELFTSTFADSWRILALKPPKLAQPEVVLFASEMSAIKRTRMTTPEAESLINTLKSKSIEEAEQSLREMKVPPEATRRLLIIAGLVKKERSEIINFAQVIGDIKGTEISYSQAEEIINTLQALSSHDADKYLEAMVIPREDRKRLLEMAEVITYAAPKKVIEKKVKEPKKKRVKEKVKRVEELQMSVKELKKELDKVPGLSDKEKNSLLEDLKKLPLQEQKEILKDLVPELEDHMSIAELKAELDKVSGLSKIEKGSLLEDMKNLSMKEQKEVLKTLKTEKVKKPPEVIGMSITELKAEIDKVPALSEKEKSTLLDDLKNLPLQEQKEILKTLVPEKIELPAEEMRMSVEELKAELDKVPSLSEKEKNNLLEDLKNLSLKEQKLVLKNLKG